MITNEYRDSYDNITLQESISIPSKVHVYSLGIEYMRQWFLSKFEDDFFKTVYVNGKHILDDYRRFNREKLTKIEKPALAIIPTVDYDYNRDFVDMKLGGLDILTRRSRFQQDIIIQDYDNNHFLRMFMEAVKINFTFKVRVSTRAQQIDLWNRMKFAFRVGATQKAFVSYDYHLPYDVMLSMAEHLGFEIQYPSEDKKNVYYPRVKNITGFLSYLNAHSMYPISYKMRTANGNCEFFMRMPDLCTHISNIDNLSLDDGEREEHLDNNFHIEMNSILTIPAPQEYFYFSSEAVSEKLTLKNDIAGLYTFRALVPPDKDEHEWRQFISTEYVDEENYVESIDLTELLDGTDLYRVIRHCIDKLFISPSIFVNIKLYNAQWERKIKMNWEDMNLYLDEPKLRSDYSQITLYVDLEYMNNQLQLLNHNENTRIQVDPAPENVSLIKSDSTYE